MIDYEIRVLVESLRNQTPVKAELKKEDKKGSIITKLWLIYLDDGSIINVLQQEGMNGRQSAIVTDEYLLSIYGEEGPK